MEGEELDCTALIAKLGGTIKIAEVIDRQLDVEKVVGEILKRKAPTGKANFGFSFYGGLKPTNFGMDVKTALKEKGISCRLVVSREKTLSSVVITKNKCLEFIVAPEIVAVTCAVQDFEEYGKRDYGRPASDSYSGMLPPKLAKMMINLAQLPQDKILLDPFCGSGTVLTEALAMGYKNIIGADLSDRAVSDSEKNVNWLIDDYGLDDINAEILQVDVRLLTQKVKSADAVVTEPFLGPALRGEPRELEMRKIVSDVEKLYVAAFCQFSHILPVGGRVVMVFPEWHLKNSAFGLRIDSHVVREGFRRIDRGELIYKRQDQKVWRQITIWEKK